ncbi:metallophosphoesterase family protein [Levilactobacillus acidifarinae]|uniref:DNA repair exonuclease n=1 Tax=Levilactobacillus acidifarinae DSM 19394 = JCM 15949 TaxID=1423715 RepID=A0A0R1LGS9_9LACO|nr:DNA repair exonuclease [Levilactobacillus acidifarinae]KRK94869.1 DNA repair exonuclease [Levilactobacillus acidifarinae DSM 19394]GEO70269.1 phosphoesterase [Levilactobacillus acidifarinae]
MKFIHAADLHLDSPFLGLTGLPTQLATQVRHSTFVAATKIFDRALAEHVDFVLLAGDLFDRAEQSVAAQAYLFDQFARLQAAQIPVVISFGNHDYATDQHQLVAYPANVTVFGANVTTTTLTLKSGETVAISGFSYPQRWVSDDVLAAYPVHAATDWHLGMLHGAVATGGANDHYAPFTLEELQQKHYDYWALGHIHHHRLLAENPPIVYAGNPQGRAINETGVKGAYLVTSHDHRLVPEFFPTAVMAWETATLTTTATTLVALGQDLTTWLKAHPAALPTLTALTITTSQVLAPEEQARLATWPALFQRTQRAALQAANRYFVRLVVAPPKTTLVAPELDQTYWEQGAAQVFTATNVQTVFGKLAQEPSLAAWLAQVTPAELQEAANQRLVQRERGDEPDVP